MLLAAQNKMLLKTHSKDLVSKGNYKMYKAQYKRSSPTGPWTTIGTSRSEKQALRLAVRKKAQGVLMVRVIDKSGSTVYSN